MDEEEFSDKPLKLPRSSFTAFRLTYSGTKDISESSKCILIGKIPIIWFDDKSPGFFTNTTQSAKTLVRKKFKSALVSVNRSIRSNSNVKVSDDHLAEISDGLNLYQKRPTKKELNPESFDNDGEEINDHRELNSSTNERHPVINYEPNVHGSETSLGNEVGDSKYEGLALSTSNESSSSTQVSDMIMRYPSDIHILGTNDLLISSPINQDDSNGKSLKKPAGSYSYSNYLEPYFTSITPSITEQDSILQPTHLTTDSMVLELDLNSRHPHFGHKESTVKRAKTNITVEQPQPAESIGAILEEEYHTRFLKKLRNLAAASKGKARTSGHGLRKKVFQSLLKRYEVGEIVKMDKMLVLTKIARKINHTSRFDENENFDSRVYERWKEYFIVLRKTDSEAEPLDIQFYDIHNSTNETKKDPEIAFKLNSSIHAHIYSKADKAICLSVPHDNGVLIYILRSSGEISNLKWLYFIRLFLDENKGSIFRVKIPELSLSFHVQVSDSMISKLNRNLEVMEVQKLKRGYKVSNSNLIEHIRGEIINRLKDIKTVEVKLWLEKNSNPWFCFKDYDRLEWVCDNSRLLYIQNELLNNSFQLELRNMATYVREIPTEDGNMITEPYPIEGFLARLTNISGNKTSLLRSFHKLLYFYSCDNILFFTKYYRAVPPSPDCVLMNKGDSSLDNELPMIYEHSPFELDENEQIVWLNKRDFEHYDNLALSELERRAQQLIKAEALIDICLIKAIRPIPLEDVKLSHKILLGVLFYGQSGLSDIEILDSAFEIEFYNGGTLQLQAPTKEAREHWVERLKSLRSYWRRRKAFELKKRIELKKFNQHLLRIDEYTDSNVVFETNNLETTRAKSDPLLCNIDGIAMSKCILLSGYLYQKYKKHSNFDQYFVVLCPGFLILFSMFKRSKKSGVWKKSTCFEHYLTIPISNCYLYSGHSTALDLLEREREVDNLNPGRPYLPRLYADGWKSSEEESLRCFTLWFGRKRQISGNDKIASKYNVKSDNYKKSTPKNPGIFNMTRKLGITGRSIVFMARSRQERELWVNKIYSEIDRFAKSN
ncbi:uncharacterized protein PRCAT00000787001 [Priceomyces carsonii]|uniref:uncharacterized protein n=1 Tax=Priceomyces carsonii TaxID=28549 RepID=UPI002EDA9E98|nr:unnamed protein product [Priceomyces carsonii]